MTIEVNGSGQAEEIHDGTVVGGPHGPDCRCDSLIADLAAITLADVAGDFVAANSEKISALGLELPNLTAGENVTEDLTDAEKLLLDAMAKAFKAGETFEQMNNMIASIVSGDLGGLLSAFGVGSEEGIPELAL